MILTTCWKNFQCFKVENCFRKIHNIFLQQLFYPKAAGLLNDIDEAAGGMSQILACSAPLVSYPDVTAFGRVLWRIDCTVLAVTSGAF